MCKSVCEMRKSMWESEREKERERERERERGRNLDKSVRWSEKEVERIENDEN